MDPTPPPTPPPTPLSPVYVPSHWFFRKKAGLTCGAAGRIPPPIPWSPKGGRGKPPIPGGKIGWTQEKGETHRQTDGQTGLSGVTAKDSCSQQCSAHGKPPHGKGRTQEAHWVHWVWGHHPRDSPWHPHPWHACDPHAGWVH